MTLLTLHEVADRLGVHYMTVYRYVRLGQLPAKQEGRIWQVRPEDLDAFVTGQSDAPPPRGSVRWSTRFVNRLLAGDEAGAWGVIEAALTSGMVPQDAYADIITPAMRAIGEKWETGAIDVATEHVASQVATRIVSRLGPQMRSRGVRRGTVVLGSTQTELHALPLSIFADLLRNARFEVRDLGANLPAEHFAREVFDADDVVAVGVGVTTGGQEAAITDTITALRGATEAPILLGGAGIDENAALALGADGYARTGEEAVVLVESLVEAARR
jgi:MerR family transcriptional regulator, light-induced transcriptional regulator